MALSFTFASPTKAAYTCTGGGDHGGATWDPATDCPGGIAGVHTNIGTLTINTGETATVLAYNGTSYGTVNITATSIAIDGTLTADAKGYLGGTGGAAGGGPGGGASGSGYNAGGGGHGGNGSTSNQGYAGGTDYDSYTAPTQMGSGGGSGGNTGGNGGGVIQLTTTGTLTIAGTITSNGGAATGGWGAGGAGGSIYIHAGSLTGSGTITANGGNAGQGGSGSGAGGRIAIYYTGTNTYTGSGTVIGATNGTVAENGTSILVDSTNNDLYLNTNQVWNANPTFEGGISSTTYHNITVENNADIHIKGYYTTNSNGVGIDFAVSNNFVVNSGATLETNGGGYAGGALQANGSGPGGGAGVSANNNISGSGGGYGGIGGTGNGNGTPGGEYGSYTAPTDLGSGGGGSQDGTGGNGGGAIKITATGAININGTISANGITTSTNEAGGSGGSIYIITGSINGNGSITANGASGVSSGITPGAGAGGRIAIYYSGLNSYTGILAPNVNGGTVSGGSTINNGENGTSILVDSTNNDLYFNTSETLNANPSFEGTLDNVSYHNITIQNNSDIHVKGYYTTNSNGTGIIFTATNNFIINSGSTLESNGAGYAGGTPGTSGAGPGGGVGVTGSNNIGAGGASYGANGGQGNGSSTIATEYGSYTAPTDLGSGGGGVIGFGSGVKGGNGGGSIKINANGTLTINGSLNVNGSNGGNGDGGSGGGAGGSIYIRTGSIIGNGTITANGGNGISGCCTYNSGSGAGGRIAIYYSGTNSYSGILSSNVNGGTTSGGSSVNSGENGTSILLDTTNNDLYLNTSETLNPNPIFEGIISTTTYHNITIQGNSSIKIKGYYTTNTNGVGLVFNTSNNFSLASGSELYMDGQGYTGGASNGGTGAGPGGGGGVNSNNNIGGSGGGYGGNGAIGNGNAAAGGTYGSATAPIDLGSGGGGDQGQAGGNGGGAVKINVNGTTDISGIVSANGITSGTGSTGGSGGSIYIISGTFSGNGSLSATGGNGTNSTYINSGGGGGGRIAVYYSKANTYTGSTNVQTNVTGNGYVATDGTIVISGQGAPILSSVSQYQSDCSTSITSGGSLDGALAVCFSGKGTDSLSPEELALQIEIEPNGTAFTNIPTYTGAYSVYSGTASTISAIYSDLSYNTSYHWQARLIDSDGYATAWTIPGGNPDFITQLSPNTRTASATIDSDTDFNSGIYSGTVINGSGTSAMLNVSPASSTYPGYKYYKSITIDNTGNTNTLTNFQVKLTLDTSSLITAGKMRSDCGDMRFTDTDMLTSISYFIESGCNTTSTVIWIKVPSIASSSTRSIYLYYGNPLATSTSNGSNTFDFYDNFSSASLDTTKWTATGVYNISNGILSITSGSIYSNSAAFSEPNEMVEANIGWGSFPNNSNQSGLTISNLQGMTSGNGNGSQNVMFMDDTTPNGYVKGWATSTGTGFNAVNAVGQFTTAQNRYNLMGVNINSSNITYYNSRTQTNTYAYSWTNPAYILLGSYEGADAGTIAIPTTNIDWILARKTTTVTPILSTGSENAISIQSGNWQSSSSTGVLKLYDISKWGDGTNTSIAFSASDSSINANDTVTYYIKTASSPAELSSSSYINIGSSHGGTIFTKTSQDLTSLGVSILPYTQIETIINSYDAQSPSLDNILIYYTPSTSTHNITTDTDTDFNKGTFSNSTLNGTGTNASVSSSYSGPSGQGYYRQITINNTSNSNSLTNYQMPLTIDTATLITSGKMRSDCGDIRFYDSDQVTSINNYWIENCNSTNSKIWVKVPSIPASSNKTIYLYYGVPTNTSLSSVTNTFIRDISGVYAAYPMIESSGTNVGDYSGSNLNSTSQSSTDIGSGMFLNGRTFNGTSDYISAPTGFSNFPSGFSVAIWAYPTSTASWSRFIDFGNGSSNNNILFARNGTTNNLTFQTYNGSSGGGQITANGVIALNTWQHFVATEDASGNVVMYKNGASIQTGTTDVIQNISRTSNFIGKSNWGSDSLYAGRMSDVYIYSRVLTSAEVSDLYNNYGYVTTNYPGHQLIRQFSGPEPISSVGSEFSTTEGTWESANNSNVFYVSSNAGWGDGINSSSIAFFLNGTNLNTNNAIEVQMRTATNSAGIANATYTTIGTISEGTSLILTKQDLDNLGISPLSYMQIKTLFIQNGSNNSGNPKLDRFILYYSPTFLPNSPANLSQYKNDGITSISNGSWTTDGISNNLVFSFSMSSNNSSDTLTPEIEIIPSSASFTGTPNFTGASVAYSGTAVTGIVKATGLSSCQTYKWQAFVSNSIGLTNGVVFNSASPNIKVTNVSPSAGAIYDGTSNGNENSNTPDIKTINANWIGFSDSCSGFSANPYQIAIGTTNGGNDILPYTQTGININSPYSTFNDNSLDLMTGKTYYVSVKATNNAGLSTIITSSGQSVTPFISFSIDSTSLNLGVWNASDSYTTFSSNVLSILSNAYNGYNVYGSMLGLLTNTNKFNETIPNFSGGTYSTPAAWGSGEYGFGYTTSSFINGVDIFSGSTKFAPFSLVAPGDIVAQNINKITGANYTGIPDTYTVKYKTVIGPNQQSGRYTSSIDYTVVPSF